ncbi:MAG: hypothetical protein LAP40_20885 [Acidobacteriia bacterium]|nr:hypothetical protein [Terriglobia bacterium]
MPYAVARPALRGELGEQGPTPGEARLLESVTARVRGWARTRPFYDDNNGANKAAESRGTESVLNALILVNRDARSGKLSDDTRTAFDHLWALQQTAGDAKGSWRWLDFAHEPFEAADSGYWGACLAALATGMAPENYRAAPAIQEHLAPLREYLNGQRGRQSVINQVALLWASTKLPGLLSPAEQKAILDEVVSQQRSDGGWSLSSLSWTWRGTSMGSLVRLWIRSNDSPVAPKTDGYATGLIVYTMQQMGVPRTDPHVMRGLAWLSTHQSPTEGSWPGYSLNNRRDPSSKTGLFMVDAATAYAVLALTAGH